MRLIKSFPDGSQLCFDRGRFDDWCVYLTLPDGTRLAPRDWQYFQRLQELGRFYGLERIYDEFVAVYVQTTGEVQEDVLRSIGQRAEVYPAQSLRVDKVLTILYAAMVAEENLANRPLKKRIKRLGVHQLLLEEFTPHEAANFSRGRKFPELDRLCRERGF